MHIYIQSNTAINIHYSSVHISAAGAPAVFGGFGRGGLVPVLVRDSASASASVSASNSTSTSASTGTIASSGLCRTSARPLRDV